MMAVRSRIAVFMLLIVSCSPVNKRTSRMYDLNTECVSDQAWTYLKNSHGLDKLKNTDFQNNYGSLN
jgi:hypothetical protein